MSDTASILVWFLNLEILCDVFSDFNTQSVTVSWVLEPVINLHVLEDYFLVYR